MTSRKAERVARANARRIVRDARTPMEQLKALDMRPGMSKRERARLGDGR